MVATQAENRALRNFVSEENYVRFKTEAQRQKAGGTRRTEVDVAIPGGRVIYTKRTDRNLLHVELQRFVVHRVFWWWEQVKERAAGLQDINKIEAAATQLKQHKMVQVYRDAQALLSQWDQFIDELELARSQNPDFEDQPEAGAATLGPSLGFGECEDEPPGLTMTVPDSKDDPEHSNIRTDARDAPLPRRPTVAELEIEAAKSHKLHCKREIERLRLKRGRKLVSCISAPNPEGKSLPSRPFTHRTSADRPGPPQPDKCHRPLVPVFAAPRSSGTGSVIDTDLGAPGAKVRRVDAECFSID